MCCTSCTPIFFFHFYLFSENWVWFSDGIPIHLNVQLLGRKVAPDQVKESKVCRGGNLRSFENFRPRPNSAISLQVAVSHNCWSLGSVHSFRPFLESHFKSNFSVQQQMTATEEKAKRRLISPARSWTCMCSCAPARRWPRAPWWCRRGRKATRECRCECQLLLARAMTLKWQFVTKIVENYFNYEYLNYTEEVGRPTTGESVGACAATSCRCRVIDPRPATRVGAAPAPTASTSFPLYSRPLQVGPACRSKSAQKWGRLGWQHIWSIAAKRVFFHRLLVLWSQCWPFYSL